MQKVESKIQLISKVDIKKDTFINHELKPFVSSSFQCSGCSENIKIEIKPYQTGFPFFNIYRNQFLTEEKIIESKLASQSSSSASHLGEYLVYDLPTLYYNEVCPNCNETFIVVFGLGESQPSKWVCKISGIWQIKINPTIV
jgi:hypothetical protein